MFFFLIEIYQFFYVKFFFHKIYSKTNFLANPSVSFRSGTNVEFIGQDFRSGQTSGEPNNQDVCC